MKHSRNTTRRLSRGAISAILALAVIAVVAAVSVANSLIAPSPEGSKVITGSVQSIPPPDKALIGSHSPTSALGRVRAKLAVLRAAAGQADVLPDAVRQSGTLRNQIQSGNGRLLRTSKSGEKLFAVPVYGGGELPLDDVGVCLLDSNAAGTCTSIADISRGQSILLADHLPELPEGFARLTGMVPDGVSEVTVALNDGGSVKLPVQSNLYLYEADFSPRSVNWTLAGKKYSQAVPGS